MSSASTALGWTSLWGALFPGRRNAAYLPTQSWPVCLHSDAPSSTRLLNIRIPRRLLCASILCPGNSTGVPGLNCHLRSDHQGVSHPRRFLCVPSPHTSACRQPFPYVAEKPNSTWPKTNSQSSAAPVLPASPSSGARTTVQSACKAAPKTRPTPPTLLQLPPEAILHSALDTSPPKSLPCRPPSFLSQWPPYPPLWGFSPLRPSTSSLVPPNPTGQSSKKSKLPD